VFNLKGLIVLRIEQISLKKFGAKKLVGTFFFYKLTKVSPAPGSADPTTCTYKWIFLGADHPHM
jgi:hypothetical protein